MSSDITSIQARIILTIEALLDNNEEATVSLISRISDIKQPTVASNARILYEKRFLHRTKELKTHYYYVTEAGKNALEAWKQTEDGKFRLEKHKKIIEVSMENYLQEKEQMGEENEIESDDGEPETTNND